MLVEVLVLLLLGAVLIGVVANSELELEVKSLNGITLDVPAKPVELASVD